MQNRILGKDLEVAAVGLGCMGFSHAYGVPTAENEAINAIRFAAENGYTFFDTAECYIGTNPDGSANINEKIVGKALKPFKDKVKIATKFGVFHHGKMLVCDSHPHHIRESVEGSLRRLGVERIDLYYQHRIDEFVAPELVAETMADLIKEGKIAHWGISEANEKYIRRAHKVCPVTAIQNRYSMMYREYENLFPLLEELNIGFVAFSPLANGLLTAKYNQSSTFVEGDYRNDMPQFTTEAYNENKELLLLIHAFADRHNATPAQISLAWMLCKKPYIVPIAGTRNIERMKENLKASDIVLSEDEVAVIDNALKNMKMSDVFGGHKTAR